MIIICCTINRLSCQHPTNSNINDKPSQLGSLQYREPRKKAIGFFFFHGHCRAALQKIINKKSYALYYVTHSLKDCLFRSQRPRPVGSTATAGPPDQNVQAGYIISQ